MAQVNNFHRMLEEARVQNFPCFPESSFAEGENIIFIYVHHISITDAWYLGDFQQGLPGLWVLFICWLLAFCGPGAKENPRSNLHCLGTRLEKIGSIFVSIFNDGIHFTFVLVLAPRMSSASPAVHHFSMLAWSGEGENSLSTHEWISLHLRLAFRILDNLKPSDGTSIFLCSFCDNIKGDVSRWDFSPFRCKPQVPSSASRCHHKFSSDVRCCNVWFKLTAHGCENCKKSH